MEFKNLHINIFRCLGTVALMLALQACDNASGGADEPDRTPIVIGSCNVPAYIDYMGTSRAGAPGDDPVALETIGIFGVSKNNTVIFDDSDIFYYTDSKNYPSIKPTINPTWPLSFAGEWPTSNKWAYANLRYWSGVDCQFYCFAPHTSYNTASNPWVSLSSNQYGYLKSFKYYNIPPFSNVPYMVADGYESASNGTVTFNMKNLSGRICVRLKIGEEYSKMRKVFVKEVYVADRDKNAKCYNCDVTFNDDHSLTQIDITEGDAYNPSSSNTAIALIPIFNNSAGLELKSDEWGHFGSLYAVHGQEIPNITISVVYDVYDLVSNEPVRVDQKVSNTIELFKTVSASKYYNINILVSPAYLYVLSDNDVKPDMLISPE